MKSIIVVKKLVKNFVVTERKSGLLSAIKSLYIQEKKTVRALKGISFNIEKGELVGFIGPNGAGKTTTLKILSGLLYPTNGFTQVLEHNPWERKPEYLKKIALIMGQKNQMWWDLPALDTFELNRAIYEIPRKTYEDTLDELVDILDVGKLLKTQVRRLSLGQRMKMELIASLLHQPEVLFMDEPTIGLDVVAQQRMRDFIFEYNRKRQSTVLLTSHNMEDLVNLCSRVIVISEGLILFDGDLKKLVTTYAKNKMIKVSFSKEIDVKRLEEIGKVIRYNFPEAELSVPRETAPMAASEILQNYPVQDLNIEETPVEEVVRRVFKGEIKQV